MKWSSYLIPDLTTEIRSQQNECSMKSHPQPCFASFAWLGLVVICGCATSLQPLATKETRTDVAEIEGNWIVESSQLSACRKGSQVRITRRDVGLYEVRTTQDGFTTDWDCESLTLAKTVFVDLFQRKKLEDDEPEHVVQIGTHAIFILNRDARHLILTGFDQSKLDRMALDDRVAVASPRNNRNVFVADSKRLQDFFAEQGLDCALPEPSIVLTPHQ